jgi:hypothetical protein
MRHLKRLHGLVCALAVLLAVSSSALAEVVTQPKTKLKPAKERGSEPRSSSETLAVKNAGQRAIAVCLADWDAATHMTRQEWRQACERSVKYDPGAFQR